jgi:hypothetical protein
MCQQLFSLPPLNGFPSYASFPSLRMSPFGWQNPATLWRLQRYVQAALSPEIAQEIHANKRIASEPKTKKMNKRSKLAATP